MRKRSSRVFLYPSSAAKNKIKTLPSVKRRLVKIWLQGKGKGGKAGTGRIMFSQQFVHCPHPILHLPALLSGFMHFGKTFSLPWRAAPAHQIFLQRAQEDPSWPHVTTNLSNSPYQCSSITLPWTKLEPEGAKHSA